MKISKRQLRRIIREAVGNGVIEVLYDRDYNTYRAPNGEEISVNLNQDSAPAEIAAIQDLAASSGATHVNDDGNVVLVKDMIMAIENGIIREAHGGAGGSFPERYGDAHEKYVVERSGVGADERFFVEVTGWRPERIVYGPFEQAKKFPSKISAERVQVTIDEIDGFFTRVQPVSFFQ
jgi:hypothetical protein